MICPHCDRDTPGTETSPGTISSTCPTCSLRLTGHGHHPDAHDIDDKGNPIASDTNLPTTVVTTPIDKPKRGRR